MTRKNCIHNLRDNCIVITHNSSKEASACTKFRHQVIAQFVLHLPGSQTFFRKWTMPQLPQCARKTHGRKPPKENRIMARLYAREERKPDAPPSDMAVAAGLPAYAYGSLQVRQNGFKVGNDAFQPF